MASKGWYHFVGNTTRMWNSVRTTSRGFSPSDVDAEYAINFWSTIAESLALPETSTPPTSTPSPARPDAHR